MKEKLNKKDILKSVIKYVMKLDDGEYYVEIEKIAKRRSSRQNRSLHLYFTLLAEELNNAGYDMKKTIRKDVDIPWNSMTIKEYIWKPIQKAYIKKESTTKINTDDINKIYDIVNKTIAERTGVAVPFPSIDNLIEYESQENTTISN